MLWEMNFYFQLFCVQVLTFWAEKLGGGGSHDTALRFLAILDAS